MAQELSQNGLAIDNVADVYAVYWITAWETSNGIVGRKNNQAQITAVKTQAANAMLATPDFAKAAPSLKQELAEAMMIQALLISASANAAAQDPAQLKAVGDAVRQGAQGMGINLDSMTLNESGFRAN